jgi:ABC-2 type transport system permease protein
MPLMFASASLFPSSYFPKWMQVISSVNPITFSAELGRSFLLGGTVDWLNFLYLAIFAAVMLIIGYFVSARWLKVE